MPSFLFVTIYSRILYQVFRLNIYLTLSWWSNNTDVLYFNWSPDTSKQGPVWASSGGHPRQLSVAEGLTSELTLRAGGCVGVCCINNARQKIKWCQRWPVPPRHKEDKVDGKLCGGLSVFSVSVISSQISSHRAYQAERAVSRCCFLFLVSHFYN